MATFYDLWNQLRAETGDYLPPVHAQRFIQDAWRAICSRIPWSFLLAEGIWESPISLTGTVTATQFTQTLTPDGALTTLINAQNNPLIGRLQLRAATQQPLANILSWDGSSTLTIDRKWQLSSGTYTVSIYRAYYPAPSDPNGDENGANLLRLLEVKDRNSNFPLSINKSHRWLDRMDPRREAVGTSTHVVNHPTISTSNFAGVGITPGETYPGMPIFELWPHPASTERRVFEVLYQKRYWTLANDKGSVESFIPDQIDSRLIMETALSRAYRWGASQIGKIPSLRGVPFPALIQDANQNAQELFLRARKEDHNLYRIHYVPRKSVV